MGAIEDHHIYGLQIRESADDGSDFPNPDADYRLAFVGEDGLWHFKDSAGSVSTPSGSTADHDHTGGGDGGDLDSPVIDGYAVFNEESAPGSAAAGTVRVYAKADGLMYSKDDAGAETALGGGGGGSASDDESAVLHMRTFA